MLCYMWQMGKELFSITELTEAVISPAMLSKNHGQDLQTCNTMSMQYHFDDNTFVSRSLM